MFPIPVFKYLWCHQPFRDNKMAARSGLGTRLGTFQLYINVECVEHELEQFIAAGL